jgi:hypothetical protein
MTVLYSSSNPRRLGARQSSLRPLRALRDKLLFLVMGASPKVRDDYPHMRKL